MITIDIKKFAHISAITVEETKKKDIENGVLDILGYLDILENIEQKSVKKIDTRQINIFRDREEKINTIEKINSIKNNAPLFFENYFAVPSLIIRKS